MSKRPTIKDVARHAGVSKSTVSLVLQGSPLVRSETREAVQASIRALNYVRNRAAASLRGTGTGLVGLVINDLRNPFFTEFATSAQMTLSRHGYATVIANSDEDAGLQHQVIRSMLEHEVSALLISPCHGEVSQSFDAILRAGLPTLQVLRRIDPGGDPFPFHSMDYEAGSRMAMAHLLDQGLRDIAFVGGIEGRPVTLERMAGYREGISANGLTPHVFHGRSTRRFGREMALHLRRTHPQIRAAICFNDLVALGMASGLTQLGTLPGSDFALIGFDDIEECSDVYPALSSVRCDVKAFGQHSASILLDWLESGQRPADPPRAPVHLEIRASSRLS